MVLDVFGDEIKRFPRANLDLPVVHDARERRHFGELPRRARAEIRRERRGRGDETAADSDHRIRPEIKSVGVGQNDRAVGVEVAENLRRIRAAD